LNDLVLLVAKCLSGFTHFVIESLHVASQPQVVAAFINRWTCTLNNRGRAPAPPADSGGGGGCFDHDDGPDDNGGGGGWFDSDGGDFD